MSKPTADWERVGDRFYRKIQLYTSIFEQDVDLENCSVVAAPYSGAIAVFRNPDRVQAYRGPQSAKNQINIYASSGVLVRQINFDRTDVVAIGWSDEEQLLVVARDGSVRVYSGLQSDFSPFSLGHGADDHGVISCRFWTSGFVALLGDNSCVVVSSYDEPRPQVLASVPSGEVVSWVAIAPEYSTSRSVEVLIAMDKTVYVLDAAECEDRGLQAGPFRHIGVSPNGKFVALYTDDSKLWVVSSDFQERFSEYDTKVKTPPRDLQWCGNNAVVLAWEDEIHLVGPNGAASKFYYDSFVHLLPEVDGIKVLSNEVCEFLQKVSDSTEAVYRFGSTSPASVLVDAADQLARKSPRADDNVQLIKSNLDEAVDTCIKAAGNEFSIHRQKQLLKAASFGKSVLDLYNSDDFVDMTEALRVLNAVRFYEVGMPLSYEQYVRLTPERLVQRLANRQQYLLALKVSEFLHLPVDRIYVHWARQKVRASNSDEEQVCEEIIRKLRGKPGISFEEVANAAYDEGRAQLATKLLEHEPRAGRQVPLLLRIGEEPLALDKAIESGDPDLVQFVLLHLRKKLPLSNFFRTINSRPMASALVQAAAEDEDQELLKDLYYQDDRRVEGSHLLLREALNANSLSSAADKLKSAQRLLQDSKENALQVQALKDTQVLLKMQEVFQKDLNETFVGLSVHDTLFKLLTLGSFKRSEKVRSEFKVDDKMFSWIKLRSMVSRRDWRELEEMSKAKKSAIGWEPYFNECLSAGKTQVAAMFIPKCTTLKPDERLEMWLKCGMVVKAGEEALKAKDRAALEDLRSNASPGDQLTLDRMISQLQKGR